MSVSAGSNMNLTWNTSEELRLKGQIRHIKAKTNDATTPIVADNEMRTYVITGSFAEEIYESSPIRHILIMPTDANDASFEIESIRMVFYKEHLAKTPSGAIWHDQSRISRPTLIAKSPEVIRFPLMLPNRPWLDLALGTVDDDPVTFRINIAPANQTVEDEVVLKRTINKPHGWEPVQVDLLKYAGQEVTLSFSLAEQEAGNLGLWGSPVIRNNGTYPAEPVRGNDGISMEPPHGVILIWADMLRSAKWPPKEPSSMIAFLRRLGPCPLLPHC
jgi:hypothetical protein